MLDWLTAESLGGAIELPFGSGRTPLATALNFVPNHTKWHAAQINTIQTIYGDHIWN